MNLDHDFVQVSKLSEDQKKVFSKNKTLFSPKSSVDTYTLRCTPESNYWGGGADVDHTQTIGGNTFKLLEGIYPILKLLGDASPHRELASPERDLSAG